MSAPCVHVHVVLLSSLCGQGLVQHAVLSRMSFSCMHSIWSILQKALVPCHRYAFKQVASSSRPPCKRANSRGREGTCLGYRQFCPSPQQSQFRGGVAGWPAHLCTPSPRAAAFALVHACLGSPQTLPAATAHAAMST